jgi:K+-transporting ATPase ATPase C chain
MVESIMAKQLRAGIVMLIALTAITGIIYPLLVTLVGQVTFPSQANGSLITVDEQVVGSSLIGQNNHDERYFWSRPSAVNYMEADAPGTLLSSGASNLSVTSNALAEQVTERDAAFREANSVPAEIAVPSDMLFASGSGLDPHISPQAARLQVDRIATIRGLDREQIAALVEQLIEAPELAILGEPRVNVLLLNIALDEMENNS